MIIQMLTKLKAFFVALYSLDRTIILTLLCLAGINILVQYSANDKVLNRLFTDIIYLSISFVLLFIIANLNISAIKHIAIPIYVVSIVLLIAVLFISCAGNRQYVAPDLASKNIKTIAILPVEMQFTGNLPKGMTPEMKQQIEETESKGFQQFLYSNILRFEGKKKKIGGAQFQSLEQTLNTL